MCGRRRRWSGHDVALSPESSWFESRVGKSILSTICSVINWYWRVLHDGNSNRYWLVSQATLKWGSCRQPCQPVTGVGKVLLQGWQTRAPAFLGKWQEEVLSLRKCVKYGLTWWSIGEDVESIFVAVRSLSGRAERYIRNGFTFKTSVQIR